MKIAVLGCGYVGLVTGSCFAKMGNDVVCVDIDKNRVSNLNKNIIPIYEPGLNEIINSSLSNSCLHFTTDIKSAIVNSDMIFIAVGTPMNKDGSSNLEYVQNAALDIGKHIDNYKIIITKSTVPVGTTKEVQKIISKKIKSRDLEIEFDVANNPEFLKQGKAVQDFNFPDRIIIGIENSKIKNKFNELYKPFSFKNEKLIFMDIASSELTKYAANAMLATKISFINELAVISDKVGADINQIRKGIGSDSRIGYSFIYPSVGYGGSCFPKDIESIINVSTKNGYRPSLLTAVSTVNQNQKKYFFNKILKRFGQDLSSFQFGIWGLSFKPGTDDMREAPSLFILNQILSHGGKVKVYDPKAMNNCKEKYFPNERNINYCQDKYDVLDNSQALILLTEWPEFRSPDFKYIKSKLIHPVIFDGKNQYDKKIVEKIGFFYYSI